MSQSAGDDWQTWHHAIKRKEIDRAIRSLYDDLDAAVAERRPVCNASGRCCRFEEFGHRLYVTGLEIAWFLGGVWGSGPGVWGNNEKTSEGSEQFMHGVHRLQLAPNSNPQTLTPNCPYQIDGLCTTHAIRPLGCRVFFCEAGTEDWQQDTTERFLDRLKQLHAEHDLPYSYMEWRAGLAEAAKALEIE